MTPRREVALALVSGALLGAAFLPLPLGFLAWFGFVPLLQAIESRLARGAPKRSLFGLGYAFGVAFFLVGVHWIALLADVAITVPWLKYPAWITAALYLAVFPAFATWLVAALVRRSGAPLAFVFPFAWLAVEELRASGELGFPWFQPGYTQHAYAPVIQLASLGSVSLVTLWVLAVNALLWSAWRGPRRGVARWGAFVVLLFPFAWGSRVLAAAPRAPGPAVALIQGNVAGEIKWAGKHQREILAKFLALTERAAALPSPGDTAAARPAIVIWPETATGSYLRKQLDQAFQVAEVVARHDVPVFSGFADYEMDAGGAVLYHNAAGLFAPRGEHVAVYAKRHLVPFGERMPFQKWLPAMGRIELGQAEWNAGGKTVLFPSRAGPFSCLICFEAIFPDIARQDVRAGARWLVNITNDEWFGNSAALYQHAAMAVFRAVENHVPLARCANTGLTLLADANGRVTDRVPVFRDTMLIGRLGTPGPPTLYAALGDWPGLAAGAIVLWLLALPLLRALTVRRSAT